MNSNANESAEAIFGKTRTIEILEATGPYSNIKVTLTDATVEEAVSELAKLRGNLSEVFPQYIEKVDIKDAFPGSTELPASKEKATSYEPTEKCSPGQAKAIWAVAKKNEIDLGDRKTYDFTKAEAKEFLDKYGDSK